MAGSNPLQASTNFVVIPTPTVMPLSTVIARFAAFFIGPSSGAWPAAASCCTSASASVFSSSLKLSSVSMAA